MATGSDNKFPKVIITEGSAPASPSAGDQKLYIDSSDHKLKRKNSGGTVQSVDGDVVGPGSATDGHLAVFDGATGKLVKDGGAPGVGGSSGTFTDYSSTSTVSGWSGTPTKQIWTYKIDRLVIVMFFISGTSNSTSASFTVPDILSNSFTNDVKIPCVQVVDNSAGVTTPGRIDMTHNSATIDVWKDAGGNNFTNSGTKVVRGSFAYFTD